MPATRVKQLSDTESILHAAINELWRLESGPLFESKLNSEAMSLRLRLANFLDNYSEFAPPDDLVKGSVATETSSKLKG